jgi:enediyne biosynthesis protein E3
MTTTEDRTTSLPVARDAYRPAGFGATIRRALFGIDPADTSFARRRFHGEAGPVRDRLERVGQSFVQGYHAALAEVRPAPLAERIDAEVERDFRGFAYEGAGMALALLDTVIPGRRSRRGRLARFLAGPAAAHTYIVHVGAGWVMGRLPVSPERYLARLADPLLRWLALDGYGFHEGFFHWPRSVARQEVPRRLHGYARRGFDQGLGRSLWFVDGADVDRLPRTIGAFPASRQPDLWGGLGLACGYAGGRTQAEVEALVAAAGPHAPELAQGVAFAAKSRQRAGNPTPQTELACRAIWDLPAEAAGAVCDEALCDLPADRPGEPAFEVWRRRIQDVFSQRRLA